MHAGVRTGFSFAEEFATLAHELAHEMLHHIVDVRLMRSSDATSIALEPAVPMRRQAFPTSIGRIAVTRSLIK